MQSQLRENTYIGLKNGAVSAIGIEAYGDYGECFVPWDSIRSIQIVLFTKHDKKLNAYYLILNGKTRRHFFSQNATNFHRLLGSEVCGENQQNLKLLTRKIAVRLPSACITPSVVSFLTDKTSSIQKINSLMEIAREAPPADFYKTAVNTLVTETLEKELGRRIHLIAAEKHRASRYFVQKGAALKAATFLKADEALDALHKDSRDAYECFLLAADIDKSNHMAQAYLALSQLERGKYNDAVTHLIRAIDKIPYPGGLTQEEEPVYGKILENLNPDNIQTSEIIERFAAIYPYRSLLHGLGMLYGKNSELYRCFVLLAEARERYEEKQYTDALSVLEEILQQYPSFIWPHYWQGLVFGKMGMKKEAAKALEKITETEPSAQAYLEIYRLYEKSIYAELLYEVQAVNPHIAMSYSLLASDMVQMEENWQQTFCLLETAGYLDYRGSLSDSILEIARLQEKQKNSIEGMGSIRRDLKKGDYFEKKYQITQIFKGGMGIVYIVYDSREQAHYAVKSFREEFFQDKTVVGLFLKEAETWISIGSHPNIIKAIFVKIYDEKPYLFLEYLKGTDLSKVIAAEGALPMERILNYSLQFCSAMSYANNTANIVHGDIKPANCLISEKDTLKITDFGIAHINTLQEMNREQTLSIRGTLPYMPPEKIMGLSEGDVLSDIYSFGVMLYEMTTGRLPFTEEELAEDLHLAVSGTPASPRDYRSDIPGELCYIIKKSMEKDKNLRFSNFTEITHILKLLYEKSTRRRYSEPVLTENDSLKAILSKAFSFLSIDKPQDALHHFSLALDKYPDNMEALLGLGQTGLKLGKYEEAEQFFARVLKKNPQDTAALKGMGEVLLNQNRHRDALAFYQKARAMSAEDLSIAVKIAAINAKLGNKKETVDILKIITQRDSGIHAAWMMLGSILLETKDYWEALDAFENGYKLIATDETTILGIVECHMALMNFEEAAKYCNKIEQSSANYRRAQMFKAEAFAKLEKYYEAIDIYQSIQKVWGEDPEITVKIAQIKEKTGEKEQALIIYRELLSDRSIPDIRLRACILALDLAFIDEATEHMKILEKTAEPEIRTLLQNELIKERDLLTKITPSIIMTMQELREDPLNSFRQAIEAKNTALAAQIMEQARLISTPERILEDYSMPLLQLRNRTGELLIQSAYLKSDRYPVEKWRQDWRGKPGKMISEFKKLGFTKNSTADHIYFQGLELVKNGRINEGRTCFEMILAKEPENTLCWYRLGRILQNQGEYHDALKCFENLTELEPFNTYYWFVKGNLHQNYGLIEGAKSCYLQAITKNPLSAYGWIGIISSHLYDGDTIMAKYLAGRYDTILSSMLSDLPVNDGYRLIRIIMQIVTERYESAWNALNEYRRKEGRSDKTFLLESLLLLHNKSYFKALEALEKVEEKENIVYLDLTARIQHALKNYGKELSALNGLRKQSPFNTWYIYLQSVNLIRQKENEQSIAAMDRIAEISKLSLLTQKAKAMLMEENRDFAQAQDIYRKTINFNEHDLTAKFNMLTLAYKNITHNRLSEDIHELEETAGDLQETAAADFDANILCGHLALLEKDYGKALQLYRTARNLRPYSEKPFFCLANCFLNVNNINASMEIIDQAPCDIGSRAAFWNNKAVVHLKKGELPESIRYINKALRFDPSDSDIIFTSAIIEFTVGNFEKCGNELDKLLLGHPSYLEAYFLQGEVAMKKNREELALEYYTKGIDMFPKNYDLHLLRGDLLMKMEITEMAIRDYNFLMKERPKDVMGWIRKSFALKKLGLYSEAENLYREAKKLFRMDMDLEDYQNPYSLMPNISKYFRPKIIGSEIQIRQMPDTNMEIAGFLLNQDEFWT